MIRKSSTSSTSRRAFFIRKLRRWFSKHGRDYPWRRTKNPYGILISEYLLQQTNADLALPTYRQFIKDYPTAESLAEADIRKLRRRSPRTPLCRLDSLGLGRSPRGRL